MGSSLRHAERTDASAGQIPSRLEGNTDSTPRRLLGIVALIAFATIAISALVGTVLAVAFARIVVTPPRTRAEDLRFIRHTKNTVTLTAAVDSLTPGRYSLWFGRDRGHAQLGDVLTADKTTVTRELLAVRRGSLVGVGRARIGGWFFERPEDLGVVVENVVVLTAVGPAPAWLIPAEAREQRWMIGVHGRAVRREETLRSVPVFREAGFNCLLVSYRNDGDAPDSSDHRYALGDTEWRDIEAAVAFAVARGAREIVLMGWSMGGATVLQFVTRSTLARHIVGVVLESPVVDWVTALHFQGTAHRLIRPVRLAGMAILAGRWSRPLVGLSTPIQLRRLDLVAGAEQLRQPILLLHSSDDGYVPITASAALAAARPDIVTFEEFHTARHTKLWNFDPDRWNAAIRAWIDTLDQPVRRSSLAPDA